MSKKELKMMEITDVYDADSGNHISSPLIGIAYVQESDGNKYIMIDGRPFTAKELRQLADHLED